MPWVSEESLLLIWVIPSLAPCYHPLFSSLLGLKLVSSLKFKGFIFISLRSSYIWFRITRSNSPMYLVQWNFRQMTNKNDVPHSYLLISSVWYLWHGSHHRCYVRSLVSSSELNSVSAPSLLREIFSTNFSSMVPLSSKQTILILLCLFLDVHKIEWRKTIFFPPISFHFCLVERGVLYTLASFSALLMFLCDMSILFFQDPQF